MGEVLTNSQLSGRRNLFYNGNFQCWQRSTSETGLGASSGYFTADRWKADIGATSAGRFTMNRTTSTPDGFNYGLVINCTTTDTSIAAGEFLLVQQRFEGQDLQHLKKGSSSAETAILSFYAKIVGSATDIVVEVFDNDNARHICKKFTLTTDWVRYYFTIPGDTTGSLDQDNAQSMTVSFCLHSGSTYTGGTLATDWAANDNSNRFVGVDSIFSSTSNEFHLAGVQWEVGSQATPFEHRSFGEELALCQRYYHEQGNYPESPNSGYEGFFVAAAYNASGARGVMHLPTKMRTTPTLSTSGNFQMLGSSNDGVNAITLADSGGNPAVALNCSTGSATTGHAFEVRSDNDQDARIQFDAEL
jgi:hypothetical protein